MATLISDTFTDSNGTAIESHTPNTDVAGWGWGAGEASTWTIQSNALKATGGTGILRALIQAGQKDIDLSVDVTVPTGNVGIVAVILRYDNGNNYWEAVNRNDGAGGSNTVTLYDITAGVPTAHGSGAATFNVNTTYTFRITSSGNTITAYWDGVQKAQYTSASAFNTRTVCGVLTWGGAGYDMVFDNFVVAGDVRVSTPQEWNDDGLDGGYIGEHPIIKNDLLYVTKAHTATTANQGVAIYDPNDGTLLEDIDTDVTLGVGAAPLVDNNNKIHIYNFSAGAIYRYNHYGTLEETLTGLTHAEWEAVAYDSANDRVLLVNGSGDLTARSSSSYTTVAWTNTDPTYSAAQISPVLINGSYIYALDNNAVLFKLNLSDGTTVDSIDLSAETINVYFPIMYDADHEYVYAGDDDGRTVYAVDVSTSTLSVAWSKQLGSAGDELKRSGAYYNSVVYMTTREIASPYRSKVYALDAHTGDIIWTNTTAFDNDAQASGVLVDEDYAYVDTYDFTVGSTYDKLMVLDLKSGKLVKAFSAIGGISSGIPVARGGYVFCPIWEGNQGIQAIRVRSGGGTGDFPWKANASTYDGYIGDYMSGDLIGVPRSTTRRISIAPKKLTAVI